ncbi:uncharacterized protein BDZ83DRAFT_276202 [Colletotrichum acutatum]|uniref:Uncharacterized protein n=1 Tax=Glomerella acutata TaxID=27357 RepID=A0AAD8XFL5_GLOAC|nr:uncharacterized protein BDZ83DRAFT_276202 [Colletotrichum acutatum]KAK1726014.1 hypothetical protein BDZ83DRAFT_276202 [Colletotrichum acutatum]
MPTPVSLGRVRLAGNIDIRHDGSPVITEQFGQSDERIWGRSNHPKPARKHTRCAVCLQPFDVARRRACLCSRMRFRPQDSLFRGTCDRNVGPSTPGCATFMLGSGSRVWLDVAERPWASANSPRPAVTVQRRFRTHPYQSTELSQGCISLSFARFSRRLRSRLTTNQLPVVQFSRRTSRCCESPARQGPDAARNRRDICTGVDRISANKQDFVTRNMLPWRDYASWRRRFKCIFSSWP